MRIIFSEANHNYQNYFFPYQVLAIRESSDDLTKIYGLGFLPFRNNSNLFYLSRSCRSNLANFSLSSENKRVLKNTSHLFAEAFPLSGFDYNASVQKACKHWAKDRGWKISTSSLKTIFKNHIFNTLYVWKDKKNSQKVTGYQVIFQNKTILHTANVFYNPEYYEVGLGTRMLIEAAKNAASNNLSYAYMGTCYSAYKRNIPGFEFFNGFEWSSNTKELKFLLKRDNKFSYTLKEKEYLSEFWQENLAKVIEKKGLKFNL